MRNEIWAEKCILSPSLISVCDLCNLERSVHQLEEAGIEMLHVDILDGHFSPSMPPERYCLPDGPNSSPNQILSGG